MHAYRTSSKLMIWRCPTPCPNISVPKASGRRFSSSPLTKSPCQITSAWQPTKALWTLHRCAAGSPPLHMPPRLLTWCAECAVRVWSQCHHRVTKAHDFILNEVKFLWYIWPCAFLYQFVSFVVCFPSSHYYDRNAAERIKKIYSSGLTTRASSLHSNLIMMTPSNSLIMILSPTCNIYYHLWNYSILSK